MEPRRPTVLLAPAVVAVCGWALIAAGASVTHPAPGAATVSEGVSGAEAVEHRASDAVGVVLASHGAPTPGQLELVRQESGVEVGVGPVGLERPEGACSSPVQLPAGFESACRTHDLGYQLLREADRRGHRLPADHRRAVDARLSRDLEHVCAREADTSGRAACDLTAVVVMAVVRANSVRQHDGPPVHEDWGVDL